MNDEVLAEDLYVMYIIVRKELGMSAGKLAAQVGHSVQKVVEKYYDIKPLDCGIFTLYNTMINNYEQWRSEKYTKVILGAKDKEWKKLSDLNILNFFIIVDAGLTELEPNTETCAALWPMKKSEAPKIVKRMQVLK